MYTEAAVRQAIDLRNQTAPGSCQNVFRAQGCYREAVVPNLTSLPDARKPHANCDSMDWQNLPEGGFQI